MAKCNPLTNVCKHRVTVAVLTDGPWLKWPRPLCLPPVELVIHIVDVLEVLKHNYREYTWYMAAATHPICGIHRREKPRYQPPVMSRTLLLLLHLSILDIYSIQYNLIQRAAQYPKQVFLHDWCPCIACSLTGCLRIRCYYTIIASTVQGVPS